MPEQTLEDVLEETEEVEETDVMKDTLKEHQDKIGHLYDADPNCWHELDPNSWSGIKCLKCHGWFCY